MRLSESETVSQMMRGRLSPSLNSARMLCTLCVCCDICLFKCSYLFLFVEIKALLGLCLVLNIDTQKIISMSILLCLCVYYNMRV